MAWTTPGTAVAGDVLTAARWNTDVRDNSNSLSRGIVAKITQTSDYSLTTSTTDVTGLSVTWTAESNRIYLVKMISYASKGTNNGNFNLFLTDSSNNSKQEASWSHFGTPSFFFAHIEVYETGLSGSITRKIRGNLSTAGGTLSGGTTFPRQMFVIDMGLA
jgi:hypothetical protein